MRHALRFVPPLVLLLGLLAWGASALLDSTGRRWFERDVDLRVALAVNGAREALLAHLRARDPGGMSGTLSAIARDERILHAAACNAELRPFAATPGYPVELGCDALAPWVRGAREGDDPAAWTIAGRMDETRSGPIHISAVPLLEGKGSAGLVLLVHDMSFVERRAGMTQRIALAAFAAMALVASIVTLLAARSSFRVWTAEVRRLLRGGSRPSEFQPILADIRDLVARLAAEAHSESPGGAWTPERLRNALKQHLHGEKVIVVANRAPYIHERKEDGTIHVLHPASGLVSALEPVMRACSGTWIAHGSGSADRDTVDARDHVAVPPGEESYEIRRVWLSAEEEKGYYYGFANEGLWPLCHLAHARPTFRRSDWEHYRHVNQSFANAAREEASSPDAILLVQDYHFALLPQMLRERLPQATILTFWHIPWPNAERFGICPWSKELLEGMLGSSILGFHTQLHCNNFLEAVDRFLEARIDREQHGVVYRGRMTLVRPYPISIEWPSRWLEGAPSVADCRAAVIAELGLREDALIGVGVDRLDYTKGIEERLLAVERLLERFPQFIGRFTFVQLAAPSRTAIERYRDLNLAVERLVERVNARFGKEGYRPIVLLRSHHEPPTVFRYYRACDVCYVSSLHDGMNLVAKEFVAARDDERGVLVLSNFTGAARELTEALIVNPYDFDQASAALATALVMPEEEQRVRLQAMRALLSQFNVYRWVGRMLLDAARLRVRDRLPISSSLHGETTG